MGDFTISRGGMKSGISAARSHKYRKIETKRNVWYITDEPCAGDSIYVSIKNEDPKAYFKGFGGATLKFEMIDGTIDEVKGPWHSNSDALFQDTGVDLRESHITYGVIAMGREYDDKMNLVMKDVIYQDDDWTCGSFDRVKAIAQGMADTLGKPVFAYSESHGGSSCGAVEPKK
jgi:small nuclear ribonucleoprotein (snRNP)-like protein